MNGNIDRDITYCKGIGCAIKEHCWRYTEGVRLREEPNLWWMNDCGMLRVAYISKRKGHERTV
jgi:hypothetical protein